MTADCENEHEGQCDWVTYKYVPQGQEGLERNTLVFKLAGASCTLDWAAGEESRNAAEELAYSLYFLLQEVVISATGELAVEKFEDLLKGESGE